MAQTKKKACPTCGGTGDIGFFQGESRFFITHEECPACCGLGYILPEDEDEAEQTQPDDPAPAADKT